MADENQNPSENHEEEEYHFSDEDIDRELSELDEDHLAQVDSGEGEAASSGKGSAFVNKLKGLTRKQIVTIAVIAIIVLFFLIKMMGGHSTQQVSFDTAKTTAKAPSLPVEQKTVAKTTATTSPAKTTASTPHFQVPSKTPSFSVPKKTQSLSLPVSGATSHTDSAQSQSTNNDDSALQQENGELKNQVGQLKSRVVGLETNITRLNEQLSELNQKLTAQVAVSKAASTPAVEQPSKPAVQKQAPAREYKLTVEAVVPGQAWLLSDNGETITVNVGDQLPNYGQVVSISPYSGEVVTSSGKVITYGTGINH